MRRRREAENGAVAVIVALLAIVLFSMAALAIDLSNAFVRARDVQRQADFAALAGGAKMGNQSSGVVPSAVVDAVRDQLNGPGGMNLPQDDGGVTAVQSSDLTNGNDADGEVRFANGGLQVVAPRVTVTYSFARVMGFNETDVGQDATVGIFSPGTGVMPVYAISGCDYGLQTITDPASGADPTIPALAHDADTNPTELSSLSPAEVAINASGVSVTLSGKKFSNTTKVGFFRADDTSVGAIVEQPVFTPAPGATGYSNNANTSISFVVPTTVTDVETVWYVRVFSAGTVNKWSARDEAQPLRVGEALLECASESSDGNFGTLKLPRNNPNADSSWIPVNMADGLEAPMTLAVHEGASADGLCSDGVNSAVVSVKPNLRIGTNCVGTDTGLPANVATAGLITGSNGYSGRLAASESSTSGGIGCAPGGGTAARVVPAQGSPSINNDTLTCFLSAGASLALIANKNYPGPAKLSSDIYNSPRFFWQPILKVEPASGGSNTYSIIDFRPAFITDESVLPTTTKGTNTASADNGLIFQSNHVEQIKVIFFSAKALPADDNGQVVTPFLGVGPRILRLID